LPGVVKAEEVRVNSFRESRGENPNLPELSEEFKAVAADAVTI